MRELLNSPMWQFVGVVLAFVALIVSILVFLKQRQRKELQYALINLTPLLSVEEELRGRVRILFDEQPVDNVYLVVLELFNSGNNPIATDDYEQPITLGFGENAQVLSSQIMRTVPEDLPVKIESKKETILLNPLLLNAGDLIVIKVLATGSENYINVKGRIRGVKQIQETIPSSNRAFIRSDIKTGLLVTVPSFFAGIFLIILDSAYVLGGIAVISVCILAWVFRIFVTYRRIKIKKYND